MLGGVDWRRKRGKPCHVSEAGREVRQTMWPRGGLQKKKKKRKTKVPGKACLEER